MVYDANGKPVNFDGAVMTELNKRTAELSRDFNLALAGQMVKQMEVDRVIKFRMLNNLPITFKGVSLFPDNVEWDGSRYATYGDLNRSR